MPGVRVGHCTREEPGWLTGVTVVLAPDGGCVAGVDVRGGGPGTRETDLLDPRNLVDRIDAVVLAGGSAYGLRAADGVVDALADAGRGWRVDEDPSHRVPIVPAAILFDLGRGGGGWRHHPDAADGAVAYARAASCRTDEAPAQGSVGAGTGAMAGRVKGGVGTASLVLASGERVGVIVAVNAVGTPRAAAATSDLGGRSPVTAGTAAGDVAAVARVPAAGTATTIGVIATDATLDKAECQKMAGVAHDGLARAISPVHTLFDGDTLFCLATCERPGPAPRDRPMRLVELMEAAAICVEQAVGNAVTAAAR